jgi:hypothetical protein
MVIILELGSANKVRVNVLHLRARVMLKVNRPIRPAKIAAI